MSGSTPIGFLDLAAQKRRLGARVDERIASVLAHCRFVLGPEVEELEAALATFCGAAHCIGVSSGTDALQIAMMAEGIGRGDAVFLPAFTYTATAEVPLVLGATPVFVDVDPATFQIDPLHLADRIDAVRRAGRLRPRAVIGVDLFGQPAPWPELRAIADRDGLFLLDDCAQAFGARLDGRRLCGAAPLAGSGAGSGAGSAAGLGSGSGWADAAATSFFPSKPLGAYGDGGALFTEDPARAALYRSLRTHGEGATRYEVLRTGMNGRLDTLQAAILLAKLELFEGELARRGAIASRYDAGLADLLRIPARVARSESAWAVYSVLLPDGSARDRLQRHLAADAISTAVYYPRPLHLQPAYAPHHDGAALTVSEDLAGRILALPIHADLDDAAIDRVIASIASIAATAAGRASG